MATKIFTKEQILKGSINEDNQQNNNWLFTAKLDKVGLTNFNKILPVEQRNDFEITSTQAIIRYKLIPSLFEDGLEGISIEPISLQAIVGYYFYDEKNNESPEQTITFSTLDKKFQYEFDTKYLKFKSNGSLYINEVELFIGNNNKISIILS